MIPQGSDWHESTLELGGIGVGMTPDGQILITVTQGTDHAASVVMAPVDVLQLAGDLYTKAITAVTERVIAASDARLRSMEDALDQEQTEAREQEASDWFKNHESGSS